jgi:hypothetical protein
VANIQSETYIGLSYVSFLYKVAVAWLCYNAQTMFNKTFYKFLISFVAVIAGTLFFILVVGMKA